MAKENKDRLGYVDDVGITIIRAPKPAPAPKEEPKGGKGTEK